MKGRTCTRCHEYKDADAFHTKMNRGKRVLNSHCKQCCQERGSVWTPDVKPEVMAWLLRPLNHA